MKNDCHICFLHIPKTGGMAVRNCLRNSFRGRFSPLVHRGKRKLSLTQRVLLATARKNKVVFALIREPFERLASAYFYLKNGATAHTDRDQRDANRTVNLYRDLEHFIQEGLHIHMRKQVHLRPQTFWMRARSKKKIEERWQLYDDIQLFRYEDMHTKFAVELDKYKPIKPVFFRPKNVTRKKEKVVLSDEAKNIVYELYKQDYEIWKSL